VTGDPLILYIPGLKPKPEPFLHRRQLFRCLLEGVRRLDPKIAAQMEDRDDCFEIVAWTYDFYGTHRDIGLDQEDINDVLTRFAASDAEKAIASSWQRQSLRWLFRVADFLPFTIPKLATEELEVHLRDLHRYAKNRQGGADAAREKLQASLRQAAGQGRKVLLLAHSMGSVIAYEVLWQLTQEGDESIELALLVTMGSPLGQKLIQRNLLSYGSSGDQRFPANIRHWINLAAVGELTAIDSKLRNDFGEMIARGLVANIDDREMYNYYHMHGALNVHAEYGYLINEVTASIVRDWWCEQTESSAQNPDSV